MNKQTFDILRLILNKSGKPVTVDELSASMNVSTRMVYNYWKEICFYCEQIKAKDAIVFNDGAFEFKMDKYDKQHITSYLDSLLFNDYRLNREERMHLMCLIFASNNYPFKSSYFEEIMMTSKNTIVSDLKDLKELLESKHIYLVKDKNNGLILKCSEKQRIELILESLNELDIINEYYLGSPCNPCVSYIVNYLKFNKYRTLVESIIREVEDEINGKVSDYNFFLLVLIVSVVLERFETGHVLDEVVELKEYEPDDVHFIDRIRYKLSTTFQLDNNSINLIIRLCINYNVKFKYNRNKDNPKYINTIINNLLLRLNNYYEMDLTSDSILMEYLNVHVSACYHRIKNDELLDNPYLEQIHDKYLNDFENLKNNIYLLENGLNIALNDGEIAYILLHILAAVERKKSLKKKPIIALVCNSGVATSNFIAEQLKNYLKADIESVKSVHDLDYSLLNEKIDLVISTVPLSNKKVPVVQVNAILTDEDYMKIFKALKKYELSGTAKEEIVPKFNPSGDLLSELIQLDRISLNVEANNWKEAIVKSAESLLWSNMITPNYIHKMIDLVAKYGPYIVITPGIALAHAAPSDGVLSPGISLIRLKNPVEFGKDGFDPVRVVICCAIEDSPDYVNALMQLLNTLKNPMFIENVIKTKDKNKILELLISNR